MFIYFFIHKLKFLKKINFEIEKNDVVIFGNEFLGSCVTLSTKIPMMIHTSEIRFSFKIYNNIFSQI